jgi:hypothetical protein
VFFGPKKQISEKKVTFVFFHFRVPSSGNEILSLLGFSRMSCCCSPLGPCAPELYNVPKKYFADLAIRIGMNDFDKDDKLWCKRHQKFLTYKVNITCIRCKKVKTGKKLRFACKHFPKAAPLDRVCVDCVIKKRQPQLGPLVPWVPPHRLQIQRLLKEKLFIMPIEVKWYRMIMAGQKRLCYFSTKVTDKSVGKMTILKVSFSNVFGFFSFLGKKK